MTLILNFLATVAGLIGKLAVIVVLATLITLNQTHAAEIDRLADHIDQNCAKHCVDADLLRIALHQGASETRVDPLWFLAVIQTESNFSTKARLKVARLHAHIAAQRQDYLHVFTTRLIRENQAIGIESLNVQGMIRNRKLAKHIGDAGWGYMRQMLTYKAVASQHCRLILADPYFPSTHLCSTCGTKFPTKLGLKLREWTCGVCGTTHQRDENAAQNLEDLARSYHYRLQAEGKSELVILAKPYRQ